METVTTNPLDEFTPDQLMEVYHRIDGIRQECEDNEWYEKAAIMRDSLKEFSDVILGYEKMSIHIVEMMYLVIREEGHPVDAYKDGDDYIVTFKFHGRFYQFWLEDWVEYETIREHMKKK